MSTVDWEGMSTLVGVIRNVPKASHDTAMGEMVRVANVVFNESQIQVPVRWGILKGSGNVDVDEAAQEVDISYGGPASDYALFVHENMAAVHKPPTKAKFLEDPMNAHARDLPEGIAEKLEFAIMTQYPHAPAKAVAAQVRAAMPHAGPRKLQSEIARSRAMSPEEVRIALAAVKGRMHRAGGK